MPLRIEIEDSKYGTRNSAGVTHLGQVITAPVAYNEPFYQSLNVAGQAFNFVTPETGKQFVVDGLIFSSNKNVSSTNGAVISIYEANGPNVITASASKLIFTLDIGRLDKGSISSLNVITSQGVWLNGSTDDATCNVTILGYYVDVE